MARRAAAVVAHVPLRVPHLAAAEIGLDHRRVAGDLARRAAGDLAALVEHHDAAGQRDDHLHDVLDDHDGDAAAMDAPHQLDRLAHLGRRQAGHRLVEQQRLGLGGERAGDLQPLAAGRAEALGRRVGQRAEPDPLQHVARLGARLARVVMAQQGADRGVVEHRHRFEGERHLEGAGESRARARASGGRRVTSAPSKVTVPEVTGRSPVRQLKKVDLPAPLGPIRPRMSPSSTDTDASSTALKAPNALVTLLARQSAWPLATSDLRRRAGRRSNSDSSPLGRKRAMMTMMAP